MIQSFKHIKVTVQEIHFNDIVNIRYFLCYYLTKALYLLQKKLEHVPDNFLDVGELTETDSKTILEKWLEKAGELIRKYDIDLYHILTYF